jgi:pimeloyl-ACP methyl ester carboxylesterase
MDSISAGEPMNHPSRRHALRWGSAFAGAAALAGCATPPAAQPPAHFVLVHGAWHASWCWRKLVPLLRAAGHGVTAVDLPARWGSAAELAQATPQHYVDAITQVLQTVPGPVVLVGHSLGGVSISLAAEQMPERIRRLVYLAAFLVPDGKTPGALAAQDKASLIGQAVRRDPSGAASLIDPAQARAVFYQDCSDEDVRAATPLLCPEPAAMSRVQMRLTNERYGRVERAYIECLQDRAISIANQRAMQAALPCQQVLRLDSGHSPFLSQTQALAAHLLRLA